MADDNNVGERDYNSNPRIMTCWRQGSYRISYRPDWNEKWPFITYYNGDAGKHFPTLRGAMAYFGSAGYGWEITP